MADMLETYHILARTSRTSLLQSIKQCEDKNKDKKQTEEAKMTRQEEIEEMATTMCGFYNNGKCAFREDESCDKFNSQECSYKEEAEALYDAGYRKVLLDIKDGKAVDVCQYAPWKLIERYAKIEVEARERTAKETERLKAENERLAKVVSEKVYDFIDNAKEIADAREAWEKQAQIDVLKKLRSRIADKESLIQSYIADGCLTIEDMYTEIDELIKEVEE